jgi:hypothetical protein
MLRALGRVPAGEISLGMLERLHLEDDWQGPGNDMSISDQVRTRAEQLLVALSMGRT